jgi:uncharacterized protein (TIGR02246 family)
MSSERFPQASRSDDEAAIRGLYEQAMDAWNKGSGEAFAAVFTEDGDLVAFDGMHFRGRKEIAPFHQRLFETYLKGTRLVGKVSDVRFLSSDVAVSHAVGGTIMRGKSAASPERDSIQTLVAVRHRGDWRFAAFQNTRVRPMGRSSGAAFIWLFTDWLWKVFGAKK